MNTIFKHKVLTGALLFSAALLGASCEDKVGIDVTPDFPFADKTMYEVVVNDTELADFVEVVNSCGAHCADSLLNTSRVYTLWAPKNGSFDKDSLIKEVENGNRDIVFNTFVKSHIANNVKAANGKLEDDNRVLLLNDKMAVFAGDYTNGYTFDGQEIEETNIRVINGVLHKISKPVAYNYNIWEYLKVAENVDSVAKFLYSYDVTKFNPSQSILGPIKDGAQTYLDSVFTTTNQLLGSWTGVGNIDKEDSTYTVYIPTNDVWNELVAQSEKHFNYNRTNTNPLSMDSTYRDSLRHHYSRINILKYMAYSENEQKYVNSPDSAVPVNNSRRGIEFAKAQLEENVVFEKKLSNGVFKVVNKSPYSVFELWHDTVSLEAENEAMRYDNTNTNPTTAYVSKNQINKDSVFLNTKISGGAYYSADCEQTSTGYAYYKLPNLLAASYKVAMVVVPRNITNDMVKEEEMLPNNFTVRIKQRDGTKTNELYNKSNITNDPMRVDTLFLPDSKGNPAVITIPYCEFFNTWNKDDFNAYIEVETKGNWRRNDKSIRLDKFIFIPVADPE